MILSKGHRSEALKEQLKMWACGRPISWPYSSLPRRRFYRLSKKSLVRFNMRGTTSRYFVTSLAVSWPKRLAPFATKLVRSACSKSNVFGGARISSLPTNGEIRRASLKTPVWEANFFPAPASLLHSPLSSRGEALRDDTKNSRVADCAPAVPELFKVR